MGAAGRDFHNFNQVYRDNPQVEVVAFTAAQISGISDRRYPATLAGSLYPDGIAIADESKLESLCRDNRIHQVVFAYSDVPHAQVMHFASKEMQRKAGQFEGWIVYRPKKNPVPEHKVKYRTLMN
jgi:predicted GTPase